MLIAKNRLPRRIMGNGQEVEKLVVSGTTWFDATSTIPVEGSPTLYKYSSKLSSSVAQMASDFIGLPSGSITDVLYKDSEGYCYVIDSDTNEIIRFNNTIDYIDRTTDPEHAKVLVTFRASDRAIIIPDGRPLFNYKTENGIISNGTLWGDTGSNGTLGPKLRFCRYLPILTYSIANSVTIVDKSNDIFISTGGSSTAWITATEKVAPQYNVLVKNEGTKDYNLKAKIGRLYLQCSAQYHTGAGTVEYGTITLDSDNSWLDTREQVFIDGTQS